MREKLLSIATLVRNALEQPEMGFSNFPRSLCQGSSKLLAKYLVEVAGITTVEAVANGTRYLPDPEEPDCPIHQSHFWLEQSGFIIDITADQFKDCWERVIVTTDRRWHDQFSGQMRLNQDVAIKLNDFLLDKYTIMLQLLSREESAKGRPIAASDSVL